MTDLNQDQVANLQRTLKAVIAVNTGLEIDWLDIEVRDDETLFEGELEGGRPFAGTHTTSGIDIEVMDLECERRDADGAPCGYPVNFEGVCEIGHK